MKSKNVIITYFGFKLIHINATSLVCVNRFYYHSSHLCRCWICSVGRNGNKAHIALLLVDGIQISFNCSQPGVLTLCSAKNTNSQLLFYQLIKIKLPV